MNRPTRRRVLGGVTTGLIAGVAGCSSGSNDESGGATAADGGVEETTAPDGARSQSTDAPTATAQTTPSGDVALNLSLRVASGSGGELDAFETLVVRFDGFELHSANGTTVSRPGDGRELDLPTLEQGTDNELTATQIPSGEYAKGVFSLPVVDARLADGSDPQLPFENVDPATIELGVMGPMEISSGASGSFSLLCRVAKTFSGDAWTANFGYQYDQ